MSEIGFFHVKVPPPPVGYWRIGGSMGVKFAQHKRPRWLTRMMCRWLLEWEWEAA